MKQMNSPLLLLSKQKHCYRSAIAQRKKPGIFSALREEKPRGLQCLSRSQGQRSHIGYLLRASIRIL